MLKGFLHMTPGQNVFTTKRAGEGSAHKILRSGMKLDQGLC